MMPGNASSFFWIASISCALVRIDPLHARVVVGLQPDEVLVVEEADRIGALVIGTPSSLATVVTCGKLEQRSPHLRPELRRLFEGNRVRHRRADPERAFVEVRHELRADERNQQQRGREQQRRRP